MLLLTLAPLFEEIHLMHWAKRSFMLSGSPAKGRQYGFKCRQACKQLGCKWRREWRSSSRVIQTFINPKEITVRLLLRFYWWPYISCSDWWTRGKSSHGSSWVAVHVILVSLLDGMQYFSLVMVLFQHFESGPSDLKALNIKAVVCII